MTLIVRRPLLRLFGLAIAGIVLLQTARPSPAQPLPPEPPPAVATAALPPLKPGDSGPHVKRLQLDLTQWGLYAGAVDGVYGFETTEAVRSLQQRQGLTIDGLVGAQIWQTLETTQGWATLALAAPSLGTAIVPLTPLVVAQPPPPPSALWLALMPLVPIVGGALTYLHRQLQQERRRTRRSRALRYPKPPRR